MTAPCRACGYSFDQVLLGAKGCPNCGGDGEGFAYIAGPMTGLPELNYPAFHRAAAALRAQGWQVVNPAENPPPNDDPTWDDWMAVSLPQVRAACLVVLLPGWEKSPGARDEHAEAEKHGIPAYTLAEVLAGEAEQ